MKYCLVFELCGLIEAKGVGRTLCWSVLLTSIWDTGTKTSRPRSTTTTHMSYFYLNK